MADVQAHTPEQIDAAVEWWAARLRSCRHSGLSAEERRDPSNHAYQIAEMMMTVLKPRVTDEQIGAFKAALSERLTADTYEARYGVLDVDYGPCRMLRESLEAAGIPANHTLPIKTIMWIRDGAVRVRYGYGAKEQQLYPAVLPGEKGE